MKTRWYVLVGSLIILFVLVIANMAHADVVVGGITQSYAAPAGQSAHGCSEGEALPGCLTGGTTNGPVVLLVGASSTVATDTVSVRLYADAPNAYNLQSYLWCSTSSTSYHPCPDFPYGYIGIYDSAGGQSGYKDYTVFAGYSSWFYNPSEFYFFQEVMTGVAGTYYTNVSGEPYVKLYGIDGGGGVPGGGVPSDDTSRIISVTPSGGATTSPVALSMQYYSSATSSIPLDTVSLDLRSIEGGGVSTLELSAAAATGTITTWSASSSATLPDGLYTAFWSLSSSESILYHIATSTSFIVGTSTWQELISLASTTPSATCSIVDIGGCMQSVIAWAFVPSTQSQELLAQSGSALLHAPPLGYYYTYRDTIRIAFSTTTIDEVMATSTRSALISIIDPMRAGAIAVFWAGWLVAQYAFFIRFILPLV